MLVSTWSADSVTRPRSQHTRAHAPSFLHIPASVSSSWHQVQAAHLLTSGLSSHAGAILSQWQSLGGPPVHAFNFLILLLWRLTSKTRSLSLCFLRLLTRRLCDFAVAGHCPWYIWTRPCPGQCSGHVDGFITIIKKLNECWKSPSQYF